MNDMSIAVRDASETDWSAGAAYVKGRFVPIAEAAIPVTDWGYRRSDVTYDVVSVWNGAFFRLDDHMRRFQASMKALRLAPPESEADMRRILTECARKLGKREAYVAMDCLRGVPRPGLPRHAGSCTNHFLAYAVPWVWVIPEDIQARGAHVVIAETPRIPEVCVDPRVKNFHWGDLTRGQFEAIDRGADTCILLDLEGRVTEGPGFNVFMVTDGVVASPDRGALEGITRMSVYELCGDMGLKSEIRPITADEMRNADEVFLATTAGGIMPASRIDGRIMGNDSPGPISARLREAFWKRRSEGWHATPIEGLPSA
jgi:branched-subunit amino acid aminotransferase/4-amino-4-deoxychorismate lyase